RQRLKYLKHALASAPLEIPGHVSECRLPLRLELCQHRLAELCDQRRAIVRARSDHDIAKAPEAVLAHRHHLAVRELDELWVERLLAKAALEPGHLLFEEL